MIAINAATTARGQHTRPGIRVLLKDGEPRNGAASVSPIYLFTGHENSVKTPFHRLFSLLLCPGLVKGSSVYWNRYANSSGIMHGKVEKKCPNNTNTRSL